MTVHDKGMDVTKEKSGILSDENRFESPVIGLGETTATNRGEWEDN